LPAMVVNDNACELDERGALESIASKLAPTVSAWARSLVGAGLPAMVVNDYAGELDKRSELESIASRLAPTVSAWARSLVGAGLPAMVVNDTACGLDKRGVLESIASKLAPTISAWAWPLVGAGLPAMVVNDTAGELDERGAPESIASKLAPTVSRDCVKGLGGRGSWSQYSPPGKSGTLPINIAPQNDGGGDVFNVIMTGDGISDPVQVIDGSRFDLDDQVELATDRGHATDLRVLCK